MFTRHAFLQNLFQGIKVLIRNEGKRIPWTAAFFSVICLGIAVSGFSKKDEDSTLGGFEESELYAEEKLQDTAEISVSEHAEIDRKPIGNILKQNTIPSLEAEEAVRERVYEAQKQAGTQQSEKEEKSSQFPCSEQDYQVMLKIVQAEAGGCDRTGKILVANVVMNRVKSDEFPDSITDVVYEGSQFSPVIDGSINQVKVSEDTIYCVNQALSGKDYSQGALYFMNRKTSQSKNAAWFDQKLTYLFQHESHEFFK